MPSIFERLSQQGTTASKQRDAEEIESRLKNEERRQKEAAALTPRKNGQKLRAMQSSPVPQDRIKQNVARSPLSQQGTAASKQRDAEKRESRLKNEECRQKEAAVLTPTKNDRKLRAMQRSPVPQNRINKNAPKSPKQRDVFYDRLAKQETISSAGHHDKNSVDGFHPPTMSPIRSRRELSATFNRLYKQDTASSKAHHDKPKEKSISPKKKVAATPPPSLLTSRLDRKASGPPIPLLMDVYIRTTKEKKSGIPFFALEMAQNEVRRQINLYAMSKISAKALAYEIMNALFHRDFTPGRHWTISSTTVEQVDASLEEALMKHKEEKGVDIQWFVGMKEAVCDHKDVHRTARASAKINISRKGIYVDEYSFFNLNDALSQVKGGNVESKKVALTAKKQDGDSVARMNEEKAAVMKAEDANAAAAAEAAKKEEEEEAAAKKAQEAAAVAEAEARRVAMEEAEAAKKAEEEEAAAKKAQEAATAETEARRLAMEEAEAAKKAEEEEAAAKKAQEAAAAEARRLAMEEAEAAKKAEEEAAAKRAQEAAATVATTTAALDDAASAGNEQVQEEVKAVETCEVANDTKVEMQ